MTSSELLSLFASGRWTQECGTDCEYRLHVIVPALTGLHIFVTVKDTPQIVVLSLRPQSLPVLCA